MALLRYLALHFKKNTKIALRTVGLLHLRSWMPSKMVQALIALRRRLSPVLLNISYYFFQYILFDEQLQPDIRQFIPVYAISYKRSTRHAT